MAPASQPKRISAPVFIACSVKMSASAKRLARRFEIEHLAASHARAASRARHSQRQLGARPPDRDGSRDRQDLEGERQQRVAGKDGRRLVEGPVDGGTSAPDIVVVHRGKVVMHQRIAVHAFQRRGGIQRRFIADAT